MTCVYRIYDSAGGLLYIGVSASAIGRMAGHVTKPWADQIARIEVEHYEHKAAALRAEREAIRAEQPMHNLLSAVPNRINRKKMREGEWVTLTVRVSPETAATFRALAARRHRSAAAELRRLIEERIAEAHAEDRKAA
jgi:predicted GIY-YIG superfamily endonuclease